MFAAATAFAESATTECPALVAYVAFATSPDTFAPATELALAATPA